MPANDLSIHVDNLSSVLELFDRIQIWRSTTGPTGSYSEITSALSQPAQLTGTVVGPWALNGKTLTLVINNADPVNIVFSGTDPIDLQTVINQINKSGFGVIASQLVASSGVLTIASALPGTGSALVASGNAATALGLSTSKVNGTAARPILTDPTTDYAFRDLDALTTYYYEYRFYSSITFQVGPFSAPFLSIPSQVINDSSMSTATVKLANSLGQPVVGRRIICVPTVPIAVGGYQVLPEQDRIIFTTDVTGLALVKLVQGATFRVLLEGTGYEREITIPNTTTFDLFALMSAAPDVFTVVQSPPMPIRSTP